VSSSASPSRYSVSGLLVAAVVFSVFTNLLMLTGPLFMLQVYDRVLVSRSEETLLVLLVLVAVLYFFYWLIEYARGRVMARVGTRLHETWQMPVFQAVLEHAALQKPLKTGSLQDLGIVRAFFSAPIVLALLDLPWTPIFILTIFLFHPFLGLMAVVGGGALIGVAIVNQALTAKKTAKAVLLAKDAQQLSQQIEAGSQIIWAQSMQRAMADRWTSLQKASLDHEINATDWTGTFSSFSKAFRFFLQSMMLALGAWLVLQSEITAGAMIAASILLGRALAPIETSVTQWPLVQSAWASWRDIRGLLANSVSEETKTNLPTPSASVSIRGLIVSRGPGDPPILQNISFDLNPGEALGVIGRSGSGKSTLARCLTGLIRPTLGEVRLAGATLDQYGNDTLGRYIGYLPQDVHFFDGTIAENIAQMEVLPNQQQVIAAAQRAQVHEIVLKLPSGYETRIGPDNTLLSGGQKQRLALARAIYNDPVLLILDEPNSALDADGSAALMAVTRAMKQEGKGVIIMTHRPAAISSCDRLLVLDHGKVSALGARDDIIRSMIKNADDVQRVVDSKAGE